eukprot:TRINITY_DN14115_c0_g4_i1.p1 TRINITY_DN14115_c0_g4~~TRINITY_DN14115_c0_g4_i1.p1  ORF type:complete len:864 (+),score=144.14 TRINITY_DN14115_c0_g4_i1:83-2674(+)
MAAEPWWGFANLFSYAAGTGDDDIAATSTMPAKGRGGPLRAETMRRYASAPGAPDQGFEPYSGEDTTGAGDPYNDLCCQAMPFPAKPLRYPGLASELFGRDGRLHNSPIEQPQFSREVLREAAFGRRDQPGYLKPGRGLPRGFYFEMGTFLKYDDEGLAQRMKGRAGVVLRLLGYRVQALGRLLLTWLTFGWCCGYCAVTGPAREPSFSEFTDFNKEVNYARFLSRHSYTIDLFKALSVVCLKSFDAIIVVQLGLSVWISDEFADLRGTDAWVLYVLIFFLSLSMAVWFYFAYRQTITTIRRDIDYVGDLVWSNNNEGNRPADDRIASDWSVRFSLFFMNLFELPYSVREVVALCHPRKGAMTFGAFGGWGRLPRTVILGYENKIMFEYEESSTFPSTVPHILFAKLPTCLVKVYIFVVYQRLWLLGISIAVSSVTLATKFAMIVEYLFKASRYRRWVLDNYEEGPPEQRTVLEKKLFTEFNFTKGPDGKLVDPGARGWLLQMLPVANRTGDERGFLARWQDRGDHYKLERICCQSGEESIPADVIEQLKIADEKGEVRTEFWYHPTRGELSYVEPREVGRRAWRYARVITVSSFVQELTFSLLRASLNMMYNIGMINLCVYLMEKDAADRIVSYVVFVIFVSTRIIWIGVGLWQSQQSIAIDWKEVGDFVTVVGLVPRMELFISNTVIHLFIIPKQVREAVALFHPEKNFQPYCSFGGKCFGPRAFVIGFATKDMFETESNHGALAQAPLLIADLIITLFLVWELTLELTRDDIRGYSSAMRKPSWSSYERSNISVLIVLSLIHCSMRYYSLRLYLRARRRYKKWLDKRWGDETDAEIHALRKQWLTHFAFMPNSGFDIDCQ